MTVIEWTEVLGNLGEFIGSLAVVATLIYLSVQVRHSRDLLEENRKIALGQAFQTRSTFRIEASRSNMNPAWTETHAKLRGGSGRVPMETLLENFENLTPSEQLQVKYFGEQGIHSAENVIFQRELGLIGEEQNLNSEFIINEYPLWERAGCFITPRVQAVIDENKSSVETDA